MKGVMQAHLFKGWITGLKMLVITDEKWASEVMNSAQNI